jgi:hypothetical protein
MIASVCSVLAGARSAIALSIPPFAPLQQSTIWADLLAIGCTFDISDSSLQLAAIASIRSVACRGLIFSRWKGMARLHACADAAQHRSRVSPPSVTPRTITRSSQWHCAALGRTLQQRLRCRSFRAAALPPVAAAVFHGSAAALPELSMTKYGAEQEAACRAVRLAAKLCQVRGAPPQPAHAVHAEMACISSYAQTVLA